MSQTATLQIGDLALSIDEAAETLRQLRAGAIDAVVVAGRHGAEVLTFKDPSHPYRLLVEAMSEGAALVTGSGVVIYNNPHLAALVDPGPHTLRGRALHELVVAEDAARVDALVGRGQKAAVHAEVRMTTSTGESIPVVLSLSPAELVGLPIVCVIATDLREHNRQEEAYGRARADIEARDRAFAVAAHELRGPLHVLLLRARDLHKKLASSSSTELAGAAEVLVRQGEMMAKLVDNLLDTGRIGVGRLELVLEELDLASEVRAAVERMRELLVGCGSTITLDLATARGRFDRVRVQQVIANLLSNAAKYGCGRPIRVFVERDEGIARLGVEDRGDGIPAEDQARILRPYERMPMSSSVPGLGLGLYITNEIVRAHSGTLQITSTVGVGSRFVVELPCAPITASPVVAVSLG